MDAFLRVAPYTPYVKFPVDRPTISTSPSSVGVELSETIQVEVSPDTPEEE